MIRTRSALSSMLLAAALATSALLAGCCEGSKCIKDPPCKPKCPCAKPCEAPCAPAPMAAPAPAPAPAPTPK